MDSLNNERQEPTSATRKMVSFSSVQMRHHERTVGHNPSVSDNGPALDLAWEYDEETCIPLEEYEENREPRRNKSDLMLRRHEREKILRFDHNVSKEDLKGAVKEIKKAKACRRDTLNRMKYEGVHEVQEKFIRSAQRLLGMRRSTQKEINALWMSSYLERKDHKMPTLNRQRTANLDDTGHLKSSFRSEVTVTKLPKDDASC